MIKRLIILLILVTGISLELMAQQSFMERYNVSMLSMREGLPSNNIGDIFTDSEGFVWLSTRGGGIVRYDGYGFSSFYTAPQGLQWRSHSSRKICEDKFHRLWIVFDEYTKVIDMRTMMVTEVSSKDKRLEEILSQRGVNILHDSEGKIWLVTMSHIHCLTFQKDGSVKDIISYQHSTYTPNITIADLDSNGKVWAGIDEGVFRLTVQKGKIEKTAISPQLSHLNGLFITSLQRQGDDVWIATNHGLRRFNANEGQITTTSWAGGKISTCHTNMVSKRHLKPSTCLPTTQYPVALGTARHGLSMQPPIR